MRKVKIFSLFLATVLLLSACAAGGEYPYDTGEHKHVFGNPYVVVPETCVAEGSQVRYCKICHEELVDTLPVPKDESQRKHDFVSTVVHATEATEGYTTLECRHCDYVVEHTDVVPARYALLTVEGVTLATPPTGVEAMAVSDTNTHVLRYAFGMESAVPVTLACRLAAALTLTEAFEAEGATISPETTVTPQTGELLGHTYTLSALLSEWLENGGADVARAMALAFGEGEEAFALRVQERLLRLGVLSGVHLNIYEESGTVTLHATAVMLARTLDTPLLTEMLKNQVGALVQVAGESPAVYYEEEHFRVTALPVEGGYRFAVLFGHSLANGVENEVY